LFIYVFDCKILPNITELENLNTENVSDFSYMFEKTEISDLTPLRNWNTSKAKSLLSMFNSCKLLKNIKILENWERIKLSRVFFYVLWMQKFIKYKSIGKLECF